MVSDEPSPFDQPLVRRETSPSLVAVVAPPASALARSSPALPCFGRHLGVFAACKYIQRGDLPSFQIGQIRCAVRTIRAAHVFALNPTLIGAGHRAAVDCVDLHIAYSDFRIFFNVQFNLCTLAVCFWFPALMMTILLPWHFLQP